jgi:hypothetical protein
VSHRAWRSKWPQVGWRVGERVTVKCHCPPDSHFPLCRPRGKTSGGREYVCGEGWLPTWGDGLAQSPAFISGPAGPAPLHPSFW